GSDSEVFSLKSLEPSPSLDHHQLNHPPLYFTVDDLPSIALNPNRSLNDQRLVILNRRCGNSDYGASEGKNKGKVYGLGNVRYPYVHDREHPE
ncbi:hypothetical protein M8C21_033613, partial [Ambrosia artemisiifolia]